MPFTTRIKPPGFVANSEGATLPSFPRAVPALIHKSCRVKNPGIQAMPVLSEAEGDGNWMVMQLPDLTAAQAYRLPSFTPDFGIHAKMTIFQHL